MSNKYSKNLSSLADIPNIAFSGYIWKSDQQAPVIINGVFNYSNINPFIVEGNLISSDGQISISIRHIGNGYLIHQYDLKALAADGVQMEEQVYVTHRIKDSSNVLFKQVWLPEKDELCESMEVLKPAFQVFVGFKN